MKFIFETGAVIECNDENIIKILRTDERYKEVLNEVKEEVTSKKSKKNKEVEK